MSFFRGESGEPCRADVFAQDGERRRVETVDTTEHSDQIPDSGRAKFWFLVLLPVFVSLTWCYKGKELQGQKNSRSRRTRCSQRLDQKAEADVRWSSPPLAPAPVPVPLFVRFRSHSCRSPSDLASLSTSYGALVPRNTSHFSADARSCSMLSENQEESGTSLSRPCT